MLALAVRDLLGLTGLVLGNWIYLRLLGARMRNQQGAQDGKVEASDCWVLLHQIEQALHLAMVILDQLDDVCRHASPLNSVVASTA